MFKKVCAIALVVLLIMAPISTCFASESAVLEELNAETILQWIVAVFRSWGLYVDLSAHEEAFEQWILENLYEFLETLPSISSLAEWIQPWRIGRDTWGNYVGNSNFLEDVEDFFQYLEQKYNLANNTVLNLYDYSIGDLTIYQWPIYCFKTTDDSLQIVKATSGGAIDSQLYSAFPIQNPQAGLQTVVLSDQLSNGTSFNYTIYKDGGISEGSGTVTLKYIYGNHASTAPYVTNLLTIPRRYIYTSYIAEYTTTQILDQLSGSIESDGFSIIINIINLPSDDPSYTTGDSITVVEDIPNYSEIEWPNSISIDNLPAIVSTGHINNLDVSSVTLPFSGFITMMGDGLDLITDIIYNFPSAIVSFALAIISATIVFGVIKVLKEH